MKNNSDNFSVITPPRMGLRGVVRGNSDYCWNDYNFDMMANLPTYNALAASWKEAPTNQRPKFLQFDRLADFTNGAFIR